MSDPVLKECPACGREVRRLIFGGTGVIFKGSGFYVTDKAGKPGVKPDISKTDTAKAGTVKNDSNTADNSGKSEVVKAEGGFDKGNSVKSDSVKPEEKTA
jgi:predicted nucleic acid-binding Zn ribbon protein